MSKKLLAVVLLLALLTPLTALAQETDGDEVYALLSPQGERIAGYAGVPDVGDEYIAGNNLHFRVTAVDHTRKEARTDALGEYAMPDVSWLSQEAQPVAGQRKAVALYCTHSDESYKPTDGTSSDEKRGGIYDVAESFKAALEKQGITVYYSDETHFPHDAGAYRRSRATAANLVEEGVDAVMDIHRDGIPDPEEYEGSVAGKDMTKVRLLVGRSNQNASANKEFAAQIKAVADRMYPGLIKDIYIGKGTYNQDLMSQAVLLEFGTYTSEKDDVLTSTGYMANVMNKTLYGGVTGAAGTKADETAENKGGWSGLIWLMIALVAGVLIYAFAASGRGKDALHKWKRSFQEMGGGLFGGRRQDGDEK